MDTHRRFTVLMIPVELKIVKCIIGFLVIISLFISCNVSQVLLVLCASCRKFVFYMLPGLEWK